MASQAVDEVLRCGGLRRALPKYSAQGTLQQYVGVGVGSPVPFSEDLGLCGSEELRVGLTPEGQPAMV